MSRRTPWLSNSNSYSSSHGNRLQPFQREQIRATVTRKRAEGTFTDAGACAMAARHGVSRSTIYRIAKPGEDGDG